jgi:hypothetical protein
MMAMNQSAPSEPAVRLPASSRTASAISTAMARSPTMEMARPTNRLSPNSVPSQPIA